jgi:queuosine precursor transporter
MSPEVFAADLGVDRRKYPRYERIYLVLAALFVVLLVLTNIIGIKLFRAPFNPEFALTTGILTYPLTFLVTDIVSEIYGKKRADFMVVLGFFMSLVMLGVVQLAVAVSAHPYWVPADGAFFASEGEYQHAFRSVFALNGILLFGSMSAYLCAQLTDNWLYHFWKRLTKGKHLWLRNNGSTWVSQLVDTAIVNSILFYLGFGMDFWVGVKIMATIYVYKVIIAIFDTPIIYLGVWATKRLLAEERQDIVGTT